MASLGLNIGSDIPAIGLGTWQVTHRYGTGASPDCRSRPIRRGRSLPPTNHNRSPPGEVKAAVKTAVEAGYRLIDCAYAYGNENEVGEALKDVIDQNIVKREDLFIISKLWNTRHHKEDVKPSLIESLNSLGLAYIDLYYIHWPIAFQRGADKFPKDSDGNMIYDDVSFLETWKALEECVDEGLIKNIGLSNFNSEQIQMVIDHARIKPAALQVEVHPYLSQEKLTKFCQERNILVNAYSCLGSPARPWAANNDQSDQPMADPAIGAIASRLGVLPAQVILRWLIQRDIVPVPKSVTPSRIQANFAVFNFQLSTDDMNAINSLNRDLRLILPTVERNGVKEPRDKNAPHFPFLIEF